MEIIKKALNSMDSFYGQDWAVTRLCATTGLLITFIVTSIKCLNQTYSSYISRIEKDWEYWLNYSDDL